VTAHATRKSFFSAAVLTIVSMAECHRSDRAKRVYANFATAAEKNLKDFNDRSVQKINTFRHKVICCDHSVKISSLFEHCRRYSAVLGFLIREIRLREGGGDFLQAITNLSSCPSNFCEIAAQFLTFRHNTLTSGNDLGFPAIPANSREIFDEK